ncbi:hypothetical protein [Gaetbulibacter saemankumensis]|uniref:hypothetical protein n=1 Tax=Gaetbulibacter saemankumensis TaxID=311208 RepID=UPI0003F737E9|nr:hypothetical protein [Gaetbulibacter saemankumensis]
METKELIKPEKIQQKIQLVKGEFTPSDAAHVIMSLIDEKINFHKIQRLQKWEGNHRAETNELDDRISELEKEKEVAKTFINKNRALQRNIKINGILEITVADNEFKE